MRETLGVSRFDGRVGARIALAERLGIPPAGIGPNAVSTEFTAGETTHA
jgi:hypothetical protein